VSATTLIKDTYRCVFTKSSSLALFALIAIAFLWMSTVLANNNLVLYVLGSDLFTFPEKLKILGTSFGAFATNFTLPEQMIVALTALLAGINVSLIAFYIKKHIGVRGETGASLFGVVVGLFGIGCASCGSVILSSLIGLSATATITAFLPFGGIEFGIIGIALLLFSTWITIKKIHTPAVCEV